MQSSRNLQVTATWYPDPAAGLGSGPMKLFFVLQLLDVLTTLIFRSMGLAETNPLVGHLMDQFGTLGGLLIVKTVAIAIGLACQMASHPGFVRKINWVYAAIVAINFLTICNAVRG